MKRWPAFSLVEIAVVLMIVGILLVRMPALMNFYKTYETKQQIDLAMRSLGAYVAKGFPLPPPDPLHSNEEFILRGELPYKELGIKRKGPVIQYAVDKALTDKNIHLDFEDKGGFCNLDLPDHFAPDVSMKKDLVAFELSAGKIKVRVTRNNFSAQYCDKICKVVPLKKSHTPTVESERVKTVKEQSPLSPEEQAHFGQA